MAKATAHPDRRLISSEDVQGTNVYGIGDEAIGEIDHLLIEKVSGRVAYAVMSFGGFLGLAHSHYPIPWSALKYDTALQGYRTGITENPTERRPRLQRRFLDRSRLGGPNPSALRRTHVLGSMSDYAQAASRQHLLYLGVPVLARWSGETPAQPAKLTSSRSLRYMPAVLNQPKLAERRKA
jgi:PRC-barrel domain